MTEHHYACSDEEGTPLFRIRSVSNEIQQGDVIRGPKRGAYKVIRRYHTYREDERQVWPSGNWVPIDGAFVTETSMELVLRFMR